MLRLQRYREKSTSHIFKRYNRLRRKHSFASGMYIQEIVYISEQYWAHIWQQYASQNICILSLWRRRHQQDYYRSVNDHKQLSMAISSWRQLENKRIRKMFYMWRAMSHSSIKKHQTIIGYLSGSVIILYCEVGES